MVLKKNGEYGLCGDYRRPVPLLHGFLFWVTGRFLPAESLVTEDFLRQLRDRPFYLPKRLPHRSLPRTALVNWTLLKHGVMRKIALLTLLGPATFFLVCDWYWITRQLDRNSNNGSSTGTASDCDSAVKEAFSLCKKCPLLKLYHLQDRECWQIPMENTFFPTSWTVFEESTNCFCRRGGRKSE
ncbi:hypothetical protein TNIN_322471 [Trichonephila inaurata madagascariensis]|uniref:Uncharacterized protein n=1 Tax=Trichonephila inaurata madagascariensis TaxID=2747483 RepID=A0A8X6YEG8_9ARAC|nr:hypothetical protein TNIN_322471 [Trichonephila inaurata madagascariensis]